MKNLEDIQKMRYDRGCIVYNTNNYTYGIVLNGKCGEDKDPCSQVLEWTGHDGVMVHTLPNRALIPIGRFIDVVKMIKHAAGERCITMDVREKQPSEKRLIDREALLSFEKMDAELCATCGEHHTAEDVIMMIKTAPTIDAVPVTRCKDCKYWQDNNDGYPHEECRWGHGETPDANDFCSYGERKEGAD